MISAFHWAPGSEGARTVELDDVPRLKGQGWIWIDFLDEDSETVYDTCATLGVSRDALAEATVSAAPLLPEGQQGYLVFQLTGLTAGRGDRLDSTELTVALGEGFLVTIHQADLFATELARHQVVASEAETFPNPTSFIGYLAWVGSRRLEVLSERFEARIDDLEELAMGADPRTIIEAHALRRDVVVLRRVLGPRRGVFDELSEMTHPLIGRDSAKQFRRLADQQSRILETLEAGRSLLGSVVDTYRGAVADQTNEIVRVLTVFSAVLLPLTLIAGIWGMNFDGLPAADNPRGFWILVSVMALLAFGLWLYFARRGFVGGPKLRNLPKAVGLGLLHIGTAPIRAVTDGVGTTMRMVGRIAESERRKPEQPS